jgi:hypothetical protein
VRRLARLRGSDRATGLDDPLWPSLLGAAQIVQPETILRWHRAGFIAFWRWKSRKRAGRPKIDRELRDLIRRMSKENPRWGASRIHGELLMLGFEVAQSTVSKYMVPGGSPSLRPAEGGATGYNSATLQHTSVIRPPSRRRSPSAIRAKRCMGVVVGRRAKKKITTGCLLTN